MGSEGSGPPVTDFVSLMNPPELALAIFVLLVTPGPTNTLVAMGGAEQGWTRAVRLIPAELGTYLAVTVPLAVLGARVLDAAPMAKTAITLVAALWVLWLALSMWRVPSTRAGDLTVTPRRVAITTMLNPKALIFGLVLLPAPGAGALLANLALFSGQVVGVAMMWAAFGASLRGSGRAQPGMPAGWRRAASLWLGTLAMYLLGRAAGFA